MGKILEQIVRTLIEVDNCVRSLPPPNRDFRSPYLRYDPSTKSFKHWNSQTRRYEHMGNPQEQYMEDEYG